MVDAQAGGVAAAAAQPGRNLGHPALGWPGRLLAAYAQLHLLIRALRADRHAAAGARGGGAGAHRLPRAAPGRAGPARRSATSGWCWACGTCWTARSRPGGSCCAARTPPGSRCCWSSTRWAGSLSRTRPLRPGTALDADLHFYPGQPPLRALIGAAPRQPAARPLGARRGPGGIAALLDDWAAALAVDPWLTLLARADFRRSRYPAAAAGSSPTRPARRSRWSPREADCWPLLAISGGAPVTGRGGVERRRAAAADRVARRPGGTAVTPASYADLRDGGHGRPGPAAAAAGRAGGPGRRARQPCWTPADPARGAAGGRRRCSARPAARELSRRGHCCRTRHRRMPEPELSRPGVGRSWPTTARRPGPGRTCWAPRRRPGSAPRRRCCPRCWTPRSRHRGAAQQPRGPGSARAGWPGARLEPGVAARRRS